MDAIDIYDKDKQPVGRITDHPKSLHPDEFRLVIHLCLFNSRGEMLIQRRLPSCAKWPGLWDFTVSGCAIAGETGRMAAMREAREELNLSLDLSEARPALTISFPRGFDELFLVKADVNLDELSLQADEVADVRWADEREILQLRADGRFTPMLPSYIQTVFRLKDLGDVMEG